MEFVLVYCPCKASLHACPLVDAFEWSEPIGIVEIPAQTPMENTTILRLYSLDNRVLNFCLTGLVYLSVSRLIIVDYIAAAKP
jgi:hypothetical protein